MAEINEFIDPRAEKQIQEYLASLTKIAEKYNVIFQAATQLDTAITKVSKTTGDTTKKQTEADKAAQEATRIAKEQKSAMEALDRQRQKALQEIEKQAQKERALQAAISMQVKTLKDAELQNKALNEAKKRVDITTKEGLKTVSDYNRKIDENNKLIKENASQEGKRKMGIGLYKEALLKVVAVVGIAIAAFKKFKEVGEIVTNFSTANSKLASVLGTSKIGITALSIDALRLGATTKYTAAQVSGLQVELAKLGKTQPEILKMTSSVLKFAAATDAELADAAKTTGVALNAFGLTSKDTERAVSAMAVGTARSALSFADFDTILSTTGAVAKVFGFTLEDTIALTGKLKDAGFDASKASTAVRNIFLNMADSSGALAQALGRPVKSLDDMVIGMQELKAKGVDLATMLDLTDKRSVAAFATFIEGGDSVLKLRDQVTGVTKELAHMVEVMQDNLKGDKLILTSAWEGFILSLEDGNGLIAKVIRGLTQAATVFLTFITPVRKLSDAMVEQRTQANALVLALSDVNTKESTREVLYRKLKEIAPDVVAGIDAENISMVKLNANLKEYNKQQLNKIILQRGQEDIDEQLNNEADAFEEITKRTEQLGVGVNKVFGDLVAAGGETKDFAINFKALFLSGKLSIGEYAKALAEYAEKSDMVTGNVVSLAIDTGKFTEAEKKYNAESSKSIDLTQKRIDLANKLGVSLDDVIASTGGVVTGTGITPEEQEAALKSAEELAKKKKDATLKNLKAEVEAYKLANKTKIVDDADFTDEMIEEEEDRLKKIAKKQEEYLDKQVELGKITQQEAANEKLELTNDIETIIADLKLEKVKQGIEKEKELERERKAFYEASIAEQNSIVARMADARVNIVKKEYAAGVISREEYDKQVKDIEFETQATLLKNTISTLNQQLLETEMADSKRLELRTQLAEAEQELDNAVTENALANEEKRLDALQNTLNTISSVGSEISNIVKGFYENESITLENEKERQLAAVGDNATAKERIEKEFAIKQAQIKRKQAMAEKASGAFSIAIETAKNIVSAFPNIFLMALAGALGVAQGAIVLSKPLPTIPGFEKGTKSAPRGLATIAEKGREIIYKDGKASVIDKPSFINLAGGEQILTNRETEKIMQMAGQGRVGYDSQMQREMAELHADFELLINVVKNKKEHFWNITERGMQHLAKEGNSWSEYINKKHRS